MAVIESLLAIAGFKIYAEGIFVITYQVGLDIATSLSIIGAAWAFILQQRRQRRIVNSQYILENLKNIINVLKDKKIEFKKVQDSLRIYVIPESVLRRHKIRNNMMILLYNTGHYRLHPSERHASF